MNMDINESIIVCYSCNREQTLKQRSDNDGDCINCNSELDFEVYYESMQNHINNLEAKSLEDVDYIGRLIEAIENSGVDVDEVLGE